eukprot:TRINITY_DN5967_c0_g3_i1.p1 TRINITY_DN5967_c0_g3~~TRINITY_DN5967_c0_g3_i1.p1  ORF type:complete len:686 (-),score=80.29 TRINITY_DN5967_c0_g3_i1:300-2357(-)
MAPSRGGGGGTSKSTAKGTKASAKASVEASGEKKSEKKASTSRFHLVLSLAIFLFGPTLVNKIRWRLSDYFSKEEVPHMLRVEGRYGLNSGVISGEYVLRAEYVNGRPSWARLDAGEPAYLLWDQCSAWIMSKFPDGGPSHCEGWVYAKRCIWMPWHCAGTWQTREGQAWTSDDTITLTPVSRNRIAPARPACSEAQRRHLASEFAMLDIVIPWVNGSDPAWLEAREKACVDFHWSAIWPDAVHRSSSVRDCLAAKESLEEAEAFRRNGGCADGAHGAEGACATSKRAMTTRESRCFLEFIQVQCAKRVDSIADHDELRYLVRSIERHMPWHRGRILLISPNGSRPQWLALGGRLRVLSQERLLRAARESSLYTSPTEDNHRSFASHGIFNDYPIEASLAFLPNASRVIMLLQDDVFFGRDVSPCDLFRSARSVGLRLFGRPFQGKALEDPYVSVYENMERVSSQHWLRIVGDELVDAHPYYRTIHAPQLLDVELLRELWKEHSDLFSSVVSSPFRHPNMTNVIALHHSEVARRASVAQKTSSHNMSPDDESRAEAHVESEFASAAEIDNVYTFSRTSVPLGQRPWMELIFNSDDDWAAKLRSVSPNTSSLPSFVSFQDNLGHGDHGELDCLREGWLNTLFPEPSSFEKSAVPPRLCERWRRSQAELDVDDNALNEVSPKVATEL